MIILVNVRSKTFEKYNLRNNHYFAWRGVADFKHPYVEESFMFEAWGAGKRFGFVPVHDQMVYWFATANTNTGNIIEKFRHFFSPIPELIEATPSQTIIETNIYDLKPLSRLVKGRVALLGDAAHPMTPNLGQGACMAIEDAVILASCLKKSSEPQDAFLEYERKRHKLVSLMVNTSRQFGMIGQIQCPLLCRMRNLAVQAVPKKFQERQLLKTFRFLGE